MLGLARVMQSLDPGAVRGWLDSEAPGVVKYPDVAEGIANWLASDTQEPVTLLIERMWRKVSFPETVCDRLAELGWPTPSTALCCCKASSTVRIC